MRACVRACVRECVRACVRVCVHACACVRGERGHDVLKAREALD